MFPDLLRRLAAAGLLAAADLAACTLCHTGTAAQTRPALFGPGLGYKLAATAAPFAIFFALAAAIYPGIPLKRAPRAER